MAKCWTQLLLLEEIRVQGVALASVQHKLDNLSLCLLHEDVSCRKQTEYRSVAQNANSLRYVISKMNLFRTCLNDCKRAVRNIYGRFVIAWDMAIETVNIAMSCKLP